MSLELEHDWQATFATPKPRIGEAAKTRLLLILCTLWLGLGLVGHQPWKPEEAQVASIIKYILASGDWIALHLSGQSAPQLAPLYYLSAAASAKLFSSWFALHDAARLASGFWMAITIFMVGLTGRELWGKGSGRQTTLVFLGSIGLVVSAHLLTPDITSLCGYAMAFYALTLAMRRPIRAGILLGTGCGISFLSKGLLSIEVIMVTTLLMPLVSKDWRNRSLFLCLSAAFVAASPWLLVWPFSLWQRSPELFRVWLIAMQPEMLHYNVAYFLKTLTWYAWPALPLAGWIIWRERLQLSANPALQLPLIFFLVLLLMLGMGAENRDISALPLLLPIAVLGGGAVDTLRRGAASALDWFGITLFGVLGFAIWLGWFAMMTGVPAKTAERMHKLSSAYVPEFGWLAFLAALALTLTWLLVVIKAKRSNRAMVTDWAVGMTLAWGLLMTLWLPWLDATKGYHGMVNSMHAALPPSYTCINSRDLGDAQRAILDYYASILVQPVESNEQVRCELYLIQDERGRNKIDPGQNWKLIWKGKRPSDRRESFRLFQRID